MSFFHIFFFLQLSIFCTWSFQPKAITQPSFVLHARPLVTERGLLSGRYDDTEETDGRPNYIHRVQVADSHPRKLLEFVYTVFPDVKRTQAKQWLQHESLLVNDEPQSKFDLPLRIGDWISVRAGKSSRMSRSRSSENGKKPYGTLPSGMKIIYEDECLFVVDKPHGLPVSSSRNIGSTGARSKKSVTNSTETSEKVGQKTIDRRNDPDVINTRTVHSIVSSFLGKRSGSSVSKVFVVNWLEDDVSGLVIFAKTALSREYLLKKWNSFGVVYTVLCEGLLFPQQGTITTYMNEELQNVRCSLSKGDIAGLKGSGSALPSVSHYRTLESVSSSPRSVDLTKASETTVIKHFQKVHSTSLMEVSLETTKRDQARAQFSFLGHSICGDYRYGPLADMESLGSSAPTPGALHSTAEGRRCMVDEKESERLVALHDPLRRLGLHFSELRLTHPTTNSALTLTSHCPTSFTDLMRRRSHITSKSSSIDLKSSEIVINSMVVVGADIQAGSSIADSRGISDTKDYESDRQQQVNIEGRLSVVNEDGQMDTLRSGSSQYAAESVSSSVEKVKVFTLSEFLGPGKVRGGAGRSNKRQQQEQDQQAPPTSKTHRRK